MQFHVNGQGTKLFGDGFALWYTKEKDALGGVFGSADRWSGMVCILLSLHYLLPHAAIATVFRCDARIRTRSYTRVVFRPLDLQGIFFDTYSNVNQGHDQYISVMLNDGTASYDHDRDGGDNKVGILSYRLM